METIVSCRSHRWFFVFVNSETTIRLKFYWLDISEIEVLQDVFEWMYIIKGGGSVYYSMSHRSLSRQVFC